MKAYYWKEKNSTDYPEKRERGKDRKRASERDRKRLWAWQIKGEGLGNGLQTEGLRAPLYEPGENIQDYAYGKRGAVSTVAPEPLGKEQGRGGAYG